MVAMDVKEEIPLVLLNGLLKTELLLRLNIPTKVFKDHAKSLKDNTKLRESPRLLNLKGINFVCN